MTWQYLWRTTPMYRANHEGGPDDLPDPVPEQFRDERSGPIEDGVGPMLHRRYQVRMDRPTSTAAEVIEAFGQEPNRGAPSEVAVFLKTRGPRGALRLGDEFVVRMPGPWDGPVRVVAATPTSLRLATLKGHLEAGQIEFSARDVGGDGDANGDRAIEFRIESWARGADRLSDLLYNKVLLAKEIQLNLWAETCLRLTRYAGAKLHDGVSIETWRVEVDDLPPAGGRGADVHDAGPRGTSRA